MITLVAALAAGLVLASPAWAHEGKIGGKKIHDLEADGFNTTDPGLDGWAIHISGPDFRPSGPASLPETTGNRGSARPHD